MFTYRNNVYVQALTPEQKSKKKDYLLQQNLTRNHIPSFEEVVDWLENEAKQEDLQVYNIFARQKKRFRSTCKDSLAAKLTPRFLDPDVSNEEEQTILDDCVDKQFLIDYESAVSYTTNKITDNQDCYRAMLIPEHIAPESLQRLGVFWSVDKRRAFPYRSRKQCRNGSKVIFKGRVDTKYLDLFYSVTNNFVFTNEEAEARFLPNAPIWIEGYYVGDDPVMKELKEYRRC